MSVNVMVMSVQRRHWSVWSTARIVSTLTPLRSMIAIAISASACVLETAGERLSVQLMNSARRSEKSQGLASASCSWRAVSSAMIL